MMGIILFDLRSEDEREFILLLPEANPCQHI